MDTKAEFNIVPNLSIQQLLCVQEYFLIFLALVDGPVTTQLNTGDVTSGGLL